jgi:hypothetical protein
MSFRRAYIFLVELLSNSIMGLLEGTYVVQFHGSLELKATTTPTAETSHFSSEEDLFLPGY